MHIVRTVSKVKSFEIESEHMFLAAGYGMTGFMGAHEPYLMMCTYLVIAGYHTFKVCRARKVSK